MKFPIFFCDILTFHLTNTKIAYSKIKIEERINYYLCRSILEMKIYHNPRCSKSRCAVDWLKENNIDFEVVEYLKNPLSKEELQQILTQLNIPASALLRKSEEVYNQYIKNETLSEDEILDLMVKFPKLIERPIVVGDTFAVIARPLEKLIEKINR